MTLIKKSSINMLLNDKRAQTIICSLLEFFLLNHTSAVFSNVEYILREQHFFPSKSEDELRIIFSRLYTIIVVVGTSSKILMTTFYDYIGAWIPRIVCHVMQTVGLICILVATPENSEVFVWLGYPLFYGGGSGLAYSYYMIIPIFPKKVGFLFGVTGLPIAFAMVWYVAIVNMGSDYKWMVGFWLACIPFSVAHTFLNMPKSKIDFDDVRLGWETRNDSFLNGKRKSENYEELETKPRSMTQMSRHSFAPPELNRSSFRDYLNTVTSLPVLCTLVWYFTVEMRCLATFQQYQSWLRFKTKEEDQIKFYTELYSLISLSEAVLDPAVGFLIDEISSRLGFKSEGKDYDLNGSITSAIFMFIGSVFACSCSVFQLFDGVGVSTVFYIISHVCLIIFLYNSRYMSFISNCGADVRGRIISTGALIQMACPFLLTLSSRLLEEVFDDDYNKLSKLFLGLTLAGAVFPVVIIIFRLKTR